MKSRIVKNYIYKFIMVVLALLMLIATILLIRANYPIVDHFMFNIVMLGFVTLIIISIFIFNKVDLNCKKNEIIILMVLIGLMILLRLLSRMLLKTEPISDFLTPSEFYLYYDTNGPYTLGDHLDGYQLYYSRYPAWYTYMRIVRIVYDVLGYNINHILNMNIILNILTVIVIYLIGRKAFTKQIGYIACGLYGLSPSMIIYAGITTPDHFTMLLFAIIAYAWVNMNQYRNNDKKLFYKWLVITIISAVSINLFKPVSILFLLVFLCSEIAVVIVPNIKNIKTVIKENYNVWLVFISTFFIATTLCTIFLKVDIKAFLKTDTVNSTPFYIFLGSTVDDEGNYSDHIGFIESAKIYEKYGEDQEGAMNEFSRLAKEQIYRNRRLIPKILLQKYQYTMASEYSYWGFANTSSIDEYTEELNKIILPFFFLIGNSYLLILYLGIFLAAIFLICNKKVNYDMSILSLIIIGYLSVLIFGAVQGRYKSLIMPLMCILAAYGFTFLNQRVGKLIRDICNYNYGFYKNKER